MKNCLSLAVVGLAGYLTMTSFAAAGGGADPKKQAGKFQITTKRADDTVEVRGEKGRTVFAVKSPFGISQAVIERQEGTWPKAVVLRLHLKRLENFRASNGNATLDAAVLVQNGKAQVRLWKDHNEDDRLDKKRPLWMDVRIVGGDGKPARELPLKDGYIEVVLPRALFEGNPKAITLNWHRSHPRSLNA
jgi:hypothetical protein